MIENIFVKVIDVAEEQLSATDAIVFVSDDKNGATSLFLGTVRNHNEGQVVKAVEYEVFKPLAETSFREVCEEALEKFSNDLRLYVVHGTGFIKVGEPSIVIAAGSPHRDEACTACRYVIEEIKKRSPIWKEEKYIDGKSAWLDGNELHANG